MLSGKIPLICVSPDLLNHIRKGLFHLPEPADAEPEEEDDHAQTEGKAGDVRIVIEDPRALKRKRDGQDKGFRRGW